MSNVDAQSVSVLSALCALDVFTRPESLLLDRGLATPRNTTTAPPPLSPAKPSADIVFNLVRELAKKAMDTGTEFLLRDTEMEVQTLVTRSNAWKRRLILLTAHTLEVFAEGVPSRPLLVVNLTPDCVVRDSLAAPYALDIVTLRDMVHVSTSSEREKLQFAGAVSRAILQPRSGAAVRVGIPKAHLPPVKQDLPKTPSRLIFDAQRSSVGSSQPSSQEHEHAMDQAQRGAVVIEGYALKLTTGKFGQPLRPRLFKKSPQRRFFQLHRHVLYYWRTEALAKARAPQSFVFLDFSTRIRRVPDLPACEVVTALRSVQLLFASERDLEVWVEALTAALEGSAASIKRYAAFARSKEGPVSASPHVSQEKHAAKESPTAPLAAAAAAAAAAAIGDSSSSSEALLPQAPLLVHHHDDASAAADVQGAATAAQQDLEEEEEPVVDPRPRHRVVVHTQGESASGAGVEVGWVHCDPAAALAAARDEIHRQVGSNAPLRFSFLRPADALRAQLGQKEPSRLTLAQELDAQLRDCLDGDGVLHLTAPAQLVAGAASFDDERRALLQEIRHLEAQLAEARRALASKRGDEQHAVDAATALGAALLALQRDGFVAAEVDIETLEKQYLTLMHPDDVSRSLLSQSSPFRVAFRRLAGEPARLKAFLDTLSSDVLAPYGIRVGRMGSPFWLKALRDVALIDHPERLKAWAKAEPWCDDDQERFAYLTAKLLARSADPSDFVVWTRDPKSTAPPPAKRPPLGSGGGGSLAHDAMAAFQQRSMRLSKSRNAGQAPVVEAAAPLVRTASDSTSPTVQGIKTPLTPTGSRSPSTAARRKLMEPAVMPEELTRASADSMHSYDQAAPHLPQVVEEKEE